jgi:hypothetical protein
MSPSGMVEIPHLQAKRKCVMPAQAGIQCDGGGTNAQNLDSRFRGNDGRVGPLLVDAIRIPRLQAQGRSIGGSE